MFTALLNWLHTWPSWLYWSVMIPWIALGFVLVILWVVLAIGSLTGPTGRLDYPTRQEREKYGFLPWLVTVVGIALVNFVSPSADLVILLCLGTGLLLPESLRAELLLWPLGNSLMWASVTAQLVMGMGLIWAVCRASDVYLSRNVCVNTRKDSLRPHELS